MKKVLVSAIAILMVAGVANAATIGLTWQGSAAQASPETPANTPITAQFYVQAGATGAAANLTGIGLILNAWQDAACTIPASDVVFQTAVTPTGIMAGWNAGGSINGALNGSQYATQFSGTAVTVPVGTSYVMDITLQHTNAAPGPISYYITINKPASSLFDSTGADYMNGTAWRPDGADTRGGARWAFGPWGGSAWERYDDNTGETYSQANNPLILVTPEPASLALLALGGFAALRRR